MSERDRRLAEGYRAKGKISATEQNQRREAGKTANNPDALRAAAEAPRTQESRDRAASHKRGLPRLG